MLPNANRLNITMHT